MGAKNTTDYGRASIFNQKTNPDDYGKGTDSATKKIYEQITGDGLVSNENRKKGK